MDKTIQTVIVAAIAIMVASSLLFLVSDNVGMFSEDTQRVLDDAECDQLQAEFEQERAFGSCRSAMELKGEAVTGGCNADGWGQCEMSAFGPNDPPTPKLALSS